MTGALFQVSDKVTLRPGWQGRIPVVPRLELGRVYCVEHAYQHQGRQYVRLVGVRCDPRRCPFQGEADIWTAALMPVGPRDQQER